jgi:DNA-binding NarL/FixJ family response regulator
VAASRGDPRRVLIVEDDDNAGMLIRVMLAHDSRLRVVGRASNGREAIEMLPSLNPDVILMDLEMPVMNGVEAIRELRAQGSSARIIVLTGSQETENVRGAREAGADAFVVKYPSASALADVILAAV